MSDDLLITPADYALSKGSAGLPDEIIRKIGLFWQSHIQPHTISKENYDSIYVTSDIHADVYKLNSLLSAAGLINSTGVEDRMGLLNNFTWLKPRTMFIIVGDIIDGAREGHTEIYDPVGDIELLLHVFIHNIRVKALQVGSDVRFTIGNHDYHSLVKKESTDLPFFYDAWVHRSAKAFFGSRGRRRAFLMPFYTCNPYFILRVDDEIAFVHGGLHSYFDNDVVDLSKDVLLIQESLDLTGDLDKLPAEAHSLFSLLVHNGPKNLTGGPLWTRYYSLGESAKVCSSVGGKFKMVVVGHCRTDQCNQTPGSLLHSIANSNKFSAECANGGCVMLGCDLGGAPQIGFVDISLSSAFRDYNRIDFDAGTGGWRNYFDADAKSIAESQRRAEFLKFTHDPTRDATHRYYNVISREKVGGVGGPQSIIYWQGQPSPVNLRKGGRRASRRMRRL